MIISIRLLNLLSYNYNLIHATNNTYAYNYSILVNRLVPEAHCYKSSSFNICLAFSDGRRPFGALVLFICGFVLEE